MKNIFIKNTIILIIGGFITKILSMLIKIIITRNISENAMSLYMLTIPSYNLFITIVSSGFGITISKLISENKINKKKLISTAFIISTIISFSLVILIIVFSKYICILLHNKDLYYPLISTILSLPFIGISSILKGYFLGKNKMHINVISNLIEQIIRIIIFMTILNKIDNDILACTFIIGSNIINEIISVIILSIFLPKTNINKKNIITYDKEIKKEILSISIPTTTSRLIGTLSYFFEPIILTNLLILNGYSNNYIKLEYGILTGYSMQLLLLPSFFSMAISQSIIPIISNAYINKRYSYIKKKVKSILLLSLIIGITYISIILINPNIFLKLIYNTNKGVDYIKVMAPIFILLYIQTPITAILQSINLSRVTMKSTICGTGIKILLIIILSFCNIGIYSYIIPILINIIFVTTNNYLILKKKLSNLS